MALQTIAVIKQQDLQQIHDLQSEIEDKQLTLSHLTEDVKNLLFAKAPVERGRWDARLAFTQMRNPPWKQIVIEQLGSGYADEVRRATKSVTRCELKIIEHAIPPLWKMYEEEAESVETDDDTESSNF
jgi:hypothetical protein